MQHFWLSLEKSWLLYPIVACYIGKHCKSIIWLMRGKRDMKCLKEFWPPGYTFTYISNHTLMLMWKPQVKRSPNKWSSLNNSWSPQVLFRGNDICFLHIYSDVFFNLSQVCISPNRTLTILRYPKLISFSYLLNCCVTSCICSMQGQSYGWAVPMRRGEDTGQSSHKDLQGIEGRVLWLRCGLRQVLEHGELHIVILQDSCVWEARHVLMLYISLPQALVDVDETYREPLLGEALYHEKALTISRVLACFDCMSELNCLFYCLIVNVPSSRFTFFFTWWQMW